MNEPVRQHPFRTIVLVALVYVAIGAVTIALSRMAPSIQLRTACRFAAWIMSAVVFAAHIVHERRWSSLPRRVALRAAAAVALATLVLAVSAVIRQSMTSNLRPSMALAIGIWPILTGVVSFLVALVVAALLSRTGRAPKYAGS